VSAPRERGQPAAEAALRTTWRDHSARGDAQRPRLRASVVIQIAMRRMLAVRHCRAHLPSTIATYRFASEPVARHQNVTRRS
jgi:hypothetical protein